MKKLSPKKKIARATKPYDKITKSDFVFLKNKKRKKRKYMQKKYCSKICFGLAIVSQMKS